MDGGARSTGGLGSYECDSCICILCYDSAYSSASLHFPYFNIVTRIGDALF